MDVKNWCLCFIRFYSVDHNCCLSFVNILSFYIFQKLFVNIEYSWSRRVNPCLLSALAMKYKIHPNFPNLNAIFVDWIYTEAILVTEQMDAMLAN